MSFTHDLVSFPLNRTRQAKASLFKPCLVWLFALVWALQATASLASETLASRPQASGEGASNKKNALLEAPEPLKFSYWIQAGPPFAIQYEERLVGGILRELGDEIARRVGRQARYERFPVLRVERNLIEGIVHLTCLTSPIWQQTPDAYHWSPEVMAGQDRFLIQAGAENDIHAYQDLRGKIIGVYHDFVYHPEIMQLFATKRAEKRVVRDVAQAMKLVKMGRIDAFIEFGSILQYELKNIAGSDLMLATLPADEFSLYCAYSKKIPLEKARLDNAINAIVSDGTMDAILEKYR